jgi:putative SOS response-associated peptidase YedK
VCGRIAYTLKPSELVAQYPWIRAAPEVPARYNIAPTDPVLTIERERAELLAWAIDGRGGGLFNLRAETALSVGHYQDLLLSRRVVVPASHFYEWRRVGSRPLPVAVSRRDGRALSLAGLIGQRDGAPAVTILTTTPNRDLQGIHNRMPVVLSDDDARAWLLETLTLERLEAMLAPCPTGFLELRPASPLVNDVRNDGPELLDPHTLPPNYQLELFR